MLDIAIVEGIRTPFAKAFGPLAAVPAHALGVVAARALLERAEIRPEQVDQVVFGNAAIPPEAPNIARVIALLAGVPQDRIAHTVHRNCASGMEAITTAAQLIQLGEAETVLAGGVESMSQIPLLYNREATAQFLNLSRAKGWWSRLGALVQFRLRHFRPVPAIKLGLTDPVSGLNMGETAEVLAEEFSVSRQDQDELALESHRRAIAAQQRCLLSEEMVPVPIEDSGGEKGVRHLLCAAPSGPFRQKVPDPFFAAGALLKQDAGPRVGQSMEALAKLRPVFKQGGTVTAGNSCSISDGAAAVLLMPGATARAKGRKPLGYLRAFQYAGCDPRRMGLGPIFATSKLLKRTGLELKEIDLVEMNEAFAAQVIANQRAFASRQFAEKELFRSEALGTIDPNRLNVNGGAIALGHPVGATGTRLVITLLKELRRRSLQRGLATLCVGGGQGAALLLESA